MAWILSKKSALLRVYTTQYAHALNKNFPARTNIFPLRPLFVATGAAAAPGVVPAPAGRLLQRRAARSFTDLRTVEGIPYDTFEEAAVVMSWT